MIVESLQSKIETASRVIGKTWPLYSFVTSNPLSGYENQHFKKAVQNAKHLLGTNVFPQASVFRQAWQQDEIDKKELKSLFSENGIDLSLEDSLIKLDSLKTLRTENSNGELDRITVKWLMVFMDEGLAEWEMPNKGDGFYKAWRSLAKYDNTITTKFHDEIPKTSSEALKQLLSNYSEKEQIEIIEYHLAALPGWTGYIKYRDETNSLWQQKYSITLEDYLAVRLWIAKCLKTEILPKENEQKTENVTAKLQYAWLKAWEKTWQKNLIKKLDCQSKNSNDNQSIPDAQMVFCIDTRSELIRRNVESKGNYETFGYAGFFGIAMDYKNLDDNISKKSCPPIVPSAYQVSEISQENKRYQFAKYHKRTERLKFVDYFLKRMKNMLPSAFGYVEGSGVFYGLSLLSRTLIPEYLYNPKRKNRLSYENNSTPKISQTKVEESFSDDISLKEKTSIVKSAFDLMGWRNFSPIVLFVGHGSHSVNNPFSSSLDCGACAASPGRHNARMLAKLANLPEVRNALKYNHDLIIPEDTQFIGAEHNTATDEIVLFDSEIPDTHKKQLDQLKINLQKAQQTATQERLYKDKKSIVEAYKKTNNWSETRPEWGLAKNAGFIIGPRSITKNINLNGQSFLHSYNWEHDPEGEALEKIMQGPMVVTQWINNHYYFSTVDNEKFGGGSKITHNITGKFGVVQGNGGDLKAGLPLQSVNETDDKMYHSPLRLSVLIQAPKENIKEILLKNENLKALLENEWIYLLVMDPNKQNAIERYQEGFDWIPVEAQRAFAQSL